ncbi:MAG: radical SAM protein [Desulfobacterales bacterium]|nr:radical SAM protein [Desulfobacterales bacterium]MBS3755923.1 radical SAM protein [Desulfobacterales bacterium]
MPRDQKTTTSLIYGPVPSRRLGRSLGVDIVPYKTCTYDCIYCQIGRTPQTTIERKPYIPAARIVSELEVRLRSGVRPDYVTVGGSGEPCLHSEIGEIILKIKEMTDVPVAVLTNGALLWSPDVRGALLPADVVLPSFDAFDAHSFQKINRPHPDISFETMIQGIADFRSVYSGRIWLEIFIIKGVNDTEDAMAAFGPHIAEINPDRIHVNTAVRPPAEKYAGQVSEEALQRLAEKLDPRAEVIAEFSGESRDGNKDDMNQEILEMLSRRPCTAQDIAAGLGLPLDAVDRQVTDMARSQTIQTRRSDGRLYYFRPAEKTTDH